MMKTDNVYNSINLKANVSSQQPASSQKVETPVKQNIKEKESEEDKKDTRAEGPDKKQIKHRGVYKKAVKREVSNRGQFKTRESEDNRKKSLESKETESEDKTLSGQEGHEKKITGKKVPDLKSDQTLAGGKFVKSQEKGAEFKELLTSLRMTFKELKDELSLRRPQEQGQPKTMDLKDLLLKSETLFSSFKSDPSLSYPITREQRALASLVTGDIKNFFHMEEEEKDIKSNDTGEVTGEGEGDIKGNGARLRPSRTGRKKYKYDGQKINYFFNPLVPRGDDKEKLEEYLKTKYSLKEATLKNLNRMTDSPTNRRTKELASPILFEPDKPIQQSPSDKKSFTTIPFNMPLTSSQTVQQEIARIKEFSPYKPSISYVAEDSLRAYKPEMYYEKLDSILYKPEISLRDPLLMSKYKPEISCVNTDTPVQLYKPELSLREPLLRAEYNPEMSYIRDANLTLTKPEVIESKSASTWVTENLNATEQKNTEISSPLDSVYKNYLYGAGTSESKETVSTRDTADKTTLTSDKPYMNPFDWRNMFCVNPYSPYANIYNSLLKSASAEQNKSSDNYEFNLLQKNTQSDVFQGKDFTAYKDMQNFYRQRRSLEIQGEDAFSRSFPYVNMFQQKSELGATDKIQNFWNDVKITENYSKDDPLGLWRTMGNVQQQPVTLSGEQQTLRDTYNNSFNDAFNKKLELEKLQNNLSLLKNFQTLDDKIKAIEGDQAKVAELDKLKNEQNLLSQDLTRLNLFKEGEVFDKNTIDTKIAGISGEITNKENEYKRLSETANQNYEKFKAGVPLLQVSDENLKKTGDQLSSLYKENKDTWVELNEETRNSLKEELSKVNLSEVNVESLQKNLKENLFFGSDTKKMELLGTTMEEMSGKSFSENDFQTALKDKGFSEQDIMFIRDALPKDKDVEDKLKILNSQELKDKLLSQSDLEKLFSEKEREIIKNNTTEISVQKLTDELALLQQKKNDKTLSAEEQQKATDTYNAANEKLSYIQNEQKKHKEAISEKEGEYINLRQQNDRLKGKDGGEISSSLLDKAKEKYKSENNGQEPPSEYIEELKKNFKLVNSRFVGNLDVDKNENTAEAQFSELETKMNIALGSKLEDLERYEKSGKRITETESEAAVNKIKQVSRNYMDESRKKCEKDTREALAAKEELNKIDTKISTLKSQGATDNDPGIIELNKEKAKFQAEYKSALSEAEKSYKEMLSNLPQSERDELQKREIELAQKSQELYKFTGENKKKENDEYNTYMLGAKIKYTELNDKLSTLDKNSEEYRTVSLELESFKKEMDGKVETHNKFEDDFLAKEKEVITLRNDLSSKRKEYGVELNLIDLQESCRVDEKTRTTLEGQLKEGTITKDGQSKTVTVDDKLKFIDSLKNNDMSRESLTDMLKDNGFSEDEINTVVKNSNPSTYASEKKVDAVKGMYVGMVPPTGNSFEDIMTEASVTKELANSKIAWTELEDAKRIGTTITVTSDMASMGDDGEGVQGFVKGTKIVLSKDAPPGTAVHEAGHIMDNYGIMDVDYQIQQLYNNKKQSGSDFATTYSGENRKEYFAEGLKLYSSTEGQETLETKDKDLFNFLQTLEKQGKLSEAKDIIEKAAKARDDVGNVLAGVGNVVGNLIGTSDTDSLSDRLSNMVMWQINDNNQKKELLDKLNADDVKGKFENSEQYDNIMTSLNKDKVVISETDLTELNKLGILKDDELNQYKDATKNTKLDPTNNIFTSLLIKQLQEEPKKEQNAAIDNYDTVKKFEELQKNNPELSGYLDDLIKKKTLDKLQTLPDKLSEDILNDLKALPEISKKTLEDSKKFTSEVITTILQNKQGLTEEEIKNDLSNGKDLYGNSKLFEYIKGMENKDPSAIKEDLNKGIELYGSKENFDPSKREELKNNNPKLYSYLEQLETEGKTPTEILNSPETAIDFYNKRKELQEKDPKLYSYLEKLEKDGKLIGDLSTLDISKDLNTYKDGNKLKNNEPELYGYLSNLQKDLDKKSLSELKADKAEDGMYVYLAKLDKEGKLYKDGAINKDYIQNDIDLYSDSKKRTYLYEKNPELFTYLANQEKEQNNEFSQKLANYKNSCNMVKEYSEWFGSGITSQADSALAILEASGKDIKVIDEASKYTLNEYIEAKLFNRDEKTRDVAKDNTEKILAGWSTLEFDKNKLDKLNGLKDTTWYGYDDKTLAKLKDKIPADKLEQIKPLLNNKSLTQDELKEKLKNFNLKDDEMQAILKNANKIKISSEQLESIKKQLGDKKNVSRDELVNILQNSGLTKEQAFKVAQEIGLKKEEFASANETSEKNNPTLKIDDKILSNFDKIALTLKDKVKPPSKLEALKKELEKNKGKEMSLEESIK
ncbi:MAG TPA: hypothetical protein PL110_13170, partial [Candidatus Eremiobacteraeota bacterium]|nr:hypothetical protein [Candidatus Eremiobacteraeota bacterium]